MTSTITRRRALMAGAAVAAAASPAVAAGLGAPSGDTAIGKLWAEAETLRGKLDAYAADVAAAERLGGIPGWMRLSGEAHALGQARYEALVSILKATPATADDLRLMARAAQSNDMANGPQLWAARQTREALASFAAA
ncbi:MAG: hypothetical protein JNK46_04845 [Methylobacteriaceae bacterium]|nr:hypothetical protein [Methylobacteriaceae bacterium]